VLVAILNSFSPDEASMLEGSRRRTPKRRIDVCDPRRVLLRHTSRCSGDSRVQVQSLWSVIQEGIPASTRCESRLLHRRRVHGRVILMSLWPGNETDTGCRPPWSVRSATHVCRSSWKVSGVRPARCTAGRQERVMKLWLRRKPPSGAGTRNRPRVWRGAGRGSPPRAEASQVAGVSLGSWCRRLTDNCYRRARSCRSPELVVSARRAIAA
jgi:hypothetical protein